VRQRLEIEILNDLACTHASLWEKADIIIAKLFFTTMTPNATLLLLLKGFVVGLNYLQTIRRSADRATRRAGVHGRVCGQGRPKAREYKPSEQNLVYGNLICKGLRE